MSNHYKHPRNGWTVRELADKTGASARSIVNWTSEPREDYLNRAEKRHQKIRALRAQGMTIRSIAKEMSVSVGTVHYALSKEQPKNS